MIKKIFLSVLLCTVCMLSMAQSQTVTHVVQRGETLESIAESYKVSVEDINKANPNADGIVYVGMKLNIPTNSNTFIKKDIAVSKIIKELTKHLQRVKWLRLPHKAQRIITVQIKHPLI